MKTFLYILAGVAIVGAILFIPLKRGRAQTSSITLDWTSPGDDGNVGTATTYQMRYSAGRPDTSSVATLDTWWNSATPITTLPSPAIAGTRQSVVVAPPSGFLAGTTIYFVMKACDEIPNCSLYSNVALKVVPDMTPPGRIIDLFTR